MLVDEVMNVPITSTKIIQHGKHDWTRKTPTISWFSFYSLPMRKQQSFYYITSAEGQALCVVILSYTEPFLGCTSETAAAICLFFLLLKWLLLVPNPISFFRALKFDRRGLPIRFPSHQRMSILFLVTRSYLVESSGVIFRVSRILGWGKSAEGSTL